MAMGVKKIEIIALSPTGTGLSGGDRIFIELARQWSSKIPVEIVTTVEGKLMIQRQKLAVKNLRIRVIAGTLPHSFLLKYIFKIFAGIGFGFTERPENKNDILVYSASDFWMDTLTAALLKMRYPLVKWVAAWYQTAPSPIGGFVEKGSRENKYRISAFLYWLSQLPMKPLISLLSDYVIVNNEEERKRFGNKNKKGKVIVLIGAVNYEDIKKYKSDFKRINKVYDAVFQGRFHPQKGVVELVEIWRKVVNEIPDAKLVMIGDGPLMENVKVKIRALNLEKNLFLLGYVFDGNLKYKTFSQSKLVVHPALYDSGGMAAAEAMAFGLPCVGFNLKSYSSYYPKGMIKVRTGDLNAFAEMIIKLLHDSSFRNRIGGEAENMIRKNWSWVKRAQQILSKII